MHSSCEAEYHAIDYACTELMYFRNLLKDDLGVDLAEVPILTDNTSAKALAEGLEQTRDAASEK